MPSGCQPIAAPCRRGRARGGSWPRPPRRAPSGPRRVRGARRPGGRPRRCGRAGARRRQPSPRPAPSRARRRSRARSAPPGGAWWVWFQLRRMPARVGTGRSLDAVAQGVDLGRLDREGVDAADDDPRRSVARTPPPSPRAGRGGSRPRGRAAPRPSSAAEGRVDVQPRGARAEAACSTQVVVLLGSDSRTRSAPMLPESGTEQEPIPLDLRRGVVYVRCPRDCKGLRERRGRTP